MNRNYAWRKRQRYVKAIRRLNNDILEHGDGYSLCNCYEAKLRKNGQTFSNFADTPKLCSKSCCGNPRRHWNELTRQELKAPKIEEWDG